MGSVLTIIAWLVAVLAIGSGTLRLILRGRGGLYAAETLALSYGIGLGIMTIYMAALSYFGIKIGSTHIAILAIFMWALGSYYRDTVGTARIHKYRLSILEKFLLAAISFAVSYAFFRAMVVPIEAYDAVAIYGMKAKIFYIAGGVPRDFFLRMKDFVNHIEYPLSIPLAEDSVYIFFGSINDVASKVVFPLYYISTLIVFYCIVHRSADRKTALMFTFFLATVPQLADYATNGYADLPLAFYFSSSVFYLLLWMKDKRGRYLALSFILSVFGAWTKSEGLALFAVNISLALIYMLTSYRSAAKQVLVYIAASAMTILAYLKVLTIFGISLNADFSTVKPDMLTALKRIPAILYEYQVQFFGPKKWNIIWILFLAGILTYLKKTFSGAMRFPTLAIFFVLAGYTVIYMITPQNFAWHLSTTVSRLFLHFLPVVVLWLALYYKEKKLDV